MSITERIINPSTGKLIPEIKHKSYTVTLYSHLIRWNVKKQKFTVRNLKTKKEVYISSYYNDAVKWVVNNSVPKQERFFSEIYPMSGGWYYIIRDNLNNNKMVYSSEIEKSKKDIEKYAKRRTGLLNVQQKEFGVR